MTTERYLDTLLAYYEEEVAGEAYFLGLIPHLQEDSKLRTLARVERHAANSVMPLLKKYALSPKSESELEAEGQGHVARHAGLEWLAFMDYMINRYPAYLDDFAALEQMAPVEDRSMLEKLTAHEVAAIAFAEKERGGEPDSLRPLKEYLEG